LPIEYRDVQVNGIRVEIYGSASERPPLLFVHGGCHGSWSWQKMAPWLAERGWLAVCLNWLGHHGSRDLPRTEALSRSILDVTTEIGQVAESLDDLPVVIGHSMGGLASLAYAYVHPVAGLALLAPVVPAGFGTQPIDLPVDPATLWTPPEEMVDAAWWGDVSPDEAQRYRSLLCAESPRAVLEATRWLCEVDTRPLRVPALVFAAELDLLVPAQAVLSLGKDIDADCITLANTGHGIPLNPVWNDAAVAIDEWLVANRQ
jgi:pimeloyl-ACP methyl ester carboxylesterase